MALKLITDKNEIYDAEKQFQEIIKNNCTYTIQGKFSYRSVSGDQENSDLYYFDKHKFWVSFPINSEEDKGYCNYFGIDDPVSNKQNTIIKELNVPKEDVDRRLSGAFAYDIDDNIFLLDRGLIRGGSPGVGKESFFKHFQGHKVALVDGDVTTEVPLVGCLESNDFIDQLSLHLHEVDRIKKIVKRPTIVVKKSFQIKNYGEFAGETSREININIKVLYEHGKIVDKLKQIIEKKGYLVGKEREDLYIVENEEITKIFEIKTDTRPGSLQKGIGQLILYSIKMPNKPVLYLVVPENLDKITEKQLSNRVGIEILTYKKKGSSITFPELTETMKKW